jgi:hypothetical protein
MAELPLAPQIAHDLIQKDEVVLLFAGHEKKGRLLGVRLSPSTDFVIFTFEDLESPKTSWVRIEEAERLLVQKEGSEWHLLTKGTS